MTKTISTKPGFDPIIVKNNWGTKDKKEYYWKGVKLDPTVEYTAEVLWNDDTVTTTTTYHSKEIGTVSDHGKNHNVSYYNMYVAGDYRGTPITVPVKIVRGFKDLRVQKWEKVA